MLGNYSMVYPDFVEISFLGFPGYRVYQDGSVWSCWKVKSLGNKKGVTFYMSDIWKQRKTGKRGNYLHITLTNKLGNKTIPLHRLVLETFIGTCPKGMECCHNNGDPEDNRIQNLRWDTKSNNQMDRIGHGTDCRGSKNPIAKLTEEDVIKIRQMWVPRKCTMKTIAKLYKVSIYTIIDIVHENSWKHI